MNEDLEMNARLSAVVDLVRLGDDANSRGETTSANSVYQIAVSLIATGECAATVPAELVGIDSPGMITFVVGRRRTVQ